LRHRYWANEEYNPWPAIADLFLGILAAALLLYSAEFLLGTPPPPQFDGFRTAAEQFYHARPEMFREEPAFGFSEARFVLQDQFLSFPACTWALAERQRAALRDFGESVLGSYASQIEVVRIEGHADSRSSASCAGLIPWADNLQLSQNRARAVLETLQGLPWVARLWGGGRIQVAGFGDTRPVDRVHPEAAINRRVELVVKFFERERKEAR